MMLMEKTAEPMLITRRKELGRLVDLLGEQKIIAVDTESNSLYAYFERVCLIQFSTDEADFLVDPLTLDELSPLGEIFSDPDIEKVFHAAEYDLLCLKRDFGFEFANLFDTMVAARILGWQAVGLGSILKQQFDVHVNKRYQRANWGRRPLPREMLNYARIDTHYLVPLRNRLKGNLEQTDLLPLALEDFNRLCSVNGSLIDNHDPDQGQTIDIWRVSGSSDLTPQQATVFRELCCYRDKVARRIDRPWFKVISDQTLLEIARRTPNNRRQLSMINGMSEKQMRRHADGILTSISDGLNSDPLYPPRQPRPSRKYLNRLERLRTWRKLTARTMGVDSDIVLPRDLLYKLAEENPRNADETAQILADVPWRLEHFGRQILNTVQGKKL